MKNRRRAILAPHLTGLLLGLGLAAPGSARADEVEECAAAAEEGQALRDRAALLQSREKLVRCAQTSCPKLIRDDCAKWLGEVDGRIPTIVLRAIDDRSEDLPKVRVLRAGAPWMDAIDGSAASVDPGPLKLRFEAEGHEPLDKEIVVAEGQRGRMVEVVLKRQGAAPPAGAATGAPTGERGDGPGPLPWIFLGVGVAGLGTFGVLQIVAQGEVSDIEEGCGATRTCTDDDLDPTRGKLVGSAIGLGLGIAGVGASVLTFVLVGDGGSDGAVRVRPRVGASGADVRVDVPLSF